MTAWVGEGGGGGRKAQYTGCPDGDKGENKCRAHGWHSAEEAPQGLRALPREGTAGSGKQQWEGSAEGPLQREGTDETALSGALKRPRCLGH
eukprot:351282-Chlamydomonas_euryale.AAC.1